MPDVKKSLEAAVRAGGKILSSYFGQILDVTEKSTLADFRTKADLESEQAVIKELKKSFPGYNIFSEENGLIDNKSEYTFSVDPLDGTNNFVLGIPYISVAIALSHNTKTIAAAVYNPILDEFYFAEKEKGAMMNGKKISVNTEKSMAKATISFIRGYTSSPDYWKRLADKLDSFPIKRLISLWSPALDFCMLASGKIECIVNDNDDGLHDVLPGKLIAAEAGALITDFRGVPEKSDENVTFIASSTKEIHNFVLKVA